MQAQRGRCARCWATASSLVGIVLTPLLAGLAILPLMVFHPIQLMVSAVTARRYADRASVAEASAPRQ